MKTQIRSNLEERNAEALMQDTIRTMDESPIVSQRLLTLPEAAHYLGCTLWSVRELIWKGKLPYTRFGKRFQVDRKDLDHLVDREKRTEGMR